MTMELSYASAGELLERYRQAWLAFDGDAWTDLFDPDVVYHDGPFDPPLTGRNALRAYLLEAAERQDQLDVVIERHWAVAPTIIAVWHASYVDRRSRARVRIAGVMTLELGGDGRIVRFHEWYDRRETPAG
jgi:ketosteroid isomerase-like protein